MPNEKFLIGVDIGSSSCKTCLVNLQGNVIVTSTKGYPTYYPRQGWAEQDPDHWYEAFKSTLKEAMQKAKVESKNALVLCIDGVTHNAVLLDHHGFPLRRTIHFTDTRSRYQAIQINKDFGEVIWNQAYHKVQPGWTLPQLLWVKENEPNVWKQIEKILFPKDYVRYRLQGGYQTDFIEATGTLMFDITRGIWSPEICSIIDFPPEKLPPTRSPFDIAGEIGKMGKEIDLPASTPIVVGSTDTAVEVFAAGALYPGQFTVKLATVARICAIADKPFPHPKLLNYPHLLFPNRWYPGTGSRSGAAFRWFHDTFLRDKKIENYSPQLNWFHFVDTIGSAIPAGSDGLIFHPYLLGESAPYFNPDLRADFLGITMRHKEAHFIRAVLEGTAFAIRDCMDLIREAGLQVLEGRIIGGGSKSSLWRRIVSDCLGLELLKPKEGDACFGAALVGGVGIGVFASPEEAVQKCVFVEERITPDMENKAVYDELFVVYKRAQALLEEINLCLSKRAAGKETRVH